MSKYIYLYRGPVTPMEEMTEEQGAAQLAAWNKWSEQVGSALVDFGLPFGVGAAVSDDGSSAAPSELNGYSIVEAGSLDEAKSFATGHPFLAEGKGRFAIEVFELVPIPGM
jgi:YCII-related domain